MHATKVFVYYRCLSISSFSHYSTAVPLDISEHTRRNQSRHRHIVHTSTCTLNIFSHMQITQVFRRSYAWAANIESTSNEIYMSLSVSYRELHDRPAIWQLAVMTHVVRYIAFTPARCQRPRSTRRSRPCGFSPQWQLTHVHVCVWGSAREGE